MIPFYIFFFTIGSLMSNELYVLCHLRCYTKFNQSCPGLSPLYKIGYLNFLAKFLLYETSCFSPFFCVFQWMLQIPGATSYIGSIGKDKFGEHMKSNSKQAGVNVSSLHIGPPPFSAGFSHSCLKEVD